MDTLELSRPKRSPAGTPAERAGAEPVERAGGRAAERRARPRAAPGAPGTAPVLDVVVPVYNEERDLARCVAELRRHLDEVMPFSAMVTIADNASTDGTWNLASRLAAELEGVRAIHLPEKGRGRALRAAWSSSTAEVLAYTDVDLSTDLNALLPLVAPIVSGHSDLAIGSRLAKGAQVRRGPKREVISRCYNAVLRLALRSRFSDAQCGFKAIRADEASCLLPLVEDDGWFFDTELLVLAERNNLRIHEIPVDWTDDPDSRVRIVSTAAADLRGIWRMLRARLGGRDRVAGLARRLDPSVARQRDPAGVFPAAALAVLALFLALRAAVGTVPAAVMALGIGIAAPPACWAWRSMCRGRWRRSGRRLTAGRQR
ncbi:MAG TPA: dolichyl-phosphate beta-glucosyltransferase [Acidimicrobiales bacterium]|nr:dolichyl-phosphate beta-glucosyltransferase [Acidimicrobiales bacterium]